MSSVAVTLTINTQEFARLYQGHTHDVICTTRDGRTVQFPATVLRQFLTHNGIYASLRASLAQTIDFLKLKNWGNSLYL